MPSGTSAPAPTRLSAPIVDAVEQHRAHANHRLVTDARTVDDSAMPNRDIRPDHHRKARVGVKDGPFLNVGARANDDGFGVATQRGIEPDAHTLRQG